MITCTVQASNENLGSPANQLEQKLVKLYTHAQDDSHTLAVLYYSPQLQIAACLQKKPVRKRSAVKQVMHRTHQPAFRVVLGLK